MSKNKTLHYFTNGLLTENPVLRLVLGTCPTLAVTTAFMNGVGMGVAATIVLMCSNMVISLLRNAIPQKVRIPAFITIIAGFVSIVQLLVKAYAPAIDSSLGIFLPLIVVNCIILARAEMFACKNSVIPSILDGLGMGIGFTATLAIMGLIREILGTGQIAISEDLIIPVTSALNIEPMLIFILPPGGFFVFGLLIALSNKIARKKGKEVVENMECEACPLKGNCSAKEELTAKSEQENTEKEENTND